jgi:hypothetical protein
MLHRKLAHRRWGTGAAAGPIYEAFAQSPVYLGGMFAPNKVARQGALMLHGQVPKLDRHSTRRALKSR